MEKQRRIYIVGAITLLFVIILVLGMSYGFWKIGFEQNEYNVSKYISITNKDELDNMNPYDLDIYYKAKRYRNDKNYYFLYLFYL